LDDKNLRRVVILGGGFGGVHTFKGLRKLIKKGQIELTLIDNSDHFLFTPFLHEVAVGKIRGSSCRILLSEILQGNNVQFLRARVFGIDILSRTVCTDLKTIPYDILVIALGSQVSYFGIPGAEELLAFKELSAAVAIKKELSLTFQESSSRPLNIVVVGGGATGVELMGEFADLFNSSAHKGLVKLLLVEAKDDILPFTHERLKKVAKQSLKNRGVKILVNAAVGKVENRYIQLANGAALPYDLAIWTAGVKSQSVFSYPALPKSRADRIEVLPTLQIKNYQNIFSLGDVAGIYPMTAQVAVAQARVVARNIKALVEQKPLSSFVYRPQGMLFSLGRWMAGAEVKVYASYISKVFCVWGIAAWWLWHVVYLIKFPWFRYKLRIIKDWCAR